MALYGLLSDSADDRNSQVWVRGRLLIPCEVHDLVRFADRSLVQPLERRRMKFDVVTADNEKMVEMIYAQALRATCALETDLPLSNTLVP